MRVIRGRGRGRGRGGAAGGRGRGRGATLGHTGGTRTPRRDQNPQETELYTPALEQQRLDEARARDNPNSTRTTRNGTVLETRNAGVNAAPEVAAPEARGMAARIVREAIAENNVATFGGKIHVYIFFRVRFEQSTVATYGGKIHDYIFFRVRYEQSTVATYCGIYQLFIIHICFYLFSRFTDEVRGTKTENCDVATYGGRIHFLHIFRVRIFG